MRKIQGLSRGAVRAVLVGSSACAMIHSRKGACGTPRANEELCRAQSQKRSRDATGSLKALSRRSGQREFAAHFGGIEEQRLTLIVDSDRSGNGTAVAGEATRSEGGTPGERWACSRYWIDYFMDRRG